jgi:NAD(P)-dependent dehydrogenase (short-subunit alcohol dehydrogenase family)
MVSTQVAAADKTLATGRLTGKRILVTGAGGLMGSDLARAFAKEGARIIVTTRTEAKIPALVEEIHALGAEVAGVAADFTNNADIDRLANVALNAFNGIDVVLLSSQPANPNLGDILGTPDSIWREQQQAIVWGPMRMMQLLAPKMMANGGGSIISIVSSTGHEPIPGYSAYGMAKGALWLFTRYMAKEWGKHGIRANALSPGLIATGDNAKALEDTVRSSGMLRRTSLDRVGLNHECIGAAIYLASDESTFTSGQCINIDGGRF